MKLSFCDVLGLLFIALKLSDHIHWSWWWVLFPFLFELALNLLVGISKALEK